jgi:WD40 repeat protein
MPFNPRRTLSSVIGVLSLCAWPAFGLPVSDSAKPEPAKPRVDALGDPLPDGAISRLGTIRLRHLFSNWVTFTADGATLLTMSHADESVRTWDRRTGRLIHSLPGACQGHIAPWPGAFNPAGNLLAIADESGVRLLEVGTGSVARTICTGRYAAASISPDGSLVVALPRLGGACTLEMWDAATGNRLWSWTAPEGATLGAAFTADGKSVVAAGWGPVRNADLPPRQDNQIRFLDIATGKEQRHIELGPAEPGMFTLSPDGRLLGAICDSKPTGERWLRDIRVWETDSGRERWRLAAPKDAGVSQVQFAPDGESLLLATMPGGVRVLDAATGKERRWLREGADWGAYALVFSPDGKVLAVCDGEAIRLLEWTTGKDVSPVADYPAVLSWYMGFMPDGRTIAGASSHMDRTMLFWDADTGRIRSRLELDEPECWLRIEGSVACSSRKDEKGLRVWDLARRQAGNWVPVGLDAVSRGQHLAPLARDVLAVSEGDFGPGVVALLEAHSGKLLHKLLVPNKFMRGVSLSSDGRRLCAGYDDKFVRVWDVRTGTLLREVGPVGGALEADRVAISPDGKWLASRGYSTQLYIEIYDAATGSLAQRFDVPGKYGGSDTLVFSPDARTLAWRSVNTREPIHLLELASGKTRQILSGWSPQFSTDGKRLLFRTTDGCRLLWDLTGRLAAGARWDKPPTQPELDQCWDTMAGQDAARAYEALRRLAAAPTEAVPFLTQLLHPIANADAEQVQRLIQDLDSDRFAVRDKAGRALDGLGEAAVPAYREALKGQLSAEVRRRLEALVKKTAQPMYYPTPDSLRQARAVEALELAGTPDARRLLERLAAGAPHAWLTQNARESLDRLAKLPRAVP